MCLTSHNGGGEIGCRRGGLFLTYIFIFLSKCQRGAENRLISVCVMSNNRLFFFFFTHLPQNAVTLNQRRKKITDAVEFVVSVFRATKLKAS